MAVFVTPAIILARAESTSVDRFYTVLTPEHGKLTLLGKGTKRITSKLAGSLEPPRIAQLWIAHGKQFDRITGCVSRVSFRATRTHLRNLVILQSFLEGLDLLTRRNDHDRVQYELALQVLDYVEVASARGDEVPQLALDTALWRLIVAGGWKPVLTHCAVCQRPYAAARPAVFSPRHGGLVCASHEQDSDGVPVDPQTVTALQTILGGVPVKALTVSAGTAERIHRLTLHSLSHTAERPLTGATLLRRLPASRAASRGTAI